MATPRPPKPPSKNKGKKNNGATPVKEKKRRPHTKIEDLPPFPPYINDVKNPLIGNMHAKRPLVIALANIINDDELLCKAVRHCGCLYIIGSSLNKVDKTPIKRNEWSGRGYAMRTGRAFQKGYKHTDKLKNCEPFAQALYESMKADTVEKDISDGIDKWNKEKGEADGGA